MSIDDQTEPTGYDKTDLNTVGRMPDRGHYDRETVHAIVKEAPFLHVSFVDHDGLPQCIPMIGALQVDEKTDEVFVYLHGHAKARLVSLLPPTTRVCLTASILDGLVLALVAFHHSMNYRSAVLHGEVVPFDANGEATPEEEEGKWEAAKQVVEKVLEGRWEACRQPTDAEMKSTGFIKVKILSASAKIRAGPPKDDKKDLNDEVNAAKTWTGVIPVTQSYGKPIPVEHNEVEKLPEYLVKALQ